MSIFLVPLCRCPRLSCCNNANCDYYFILCRNVRRNSNVSISWDELKNILEIGVSISDLSAISQYCISPATLIELQAVVLWNVGVFIWIPCWTTPLFCQRSTQCGGEWLRLPPCSADGAHGCIRDSQQAKFCSEIKAHSIACTRIWTTDLLITSEMRYHCAIRANIMNDWVRSGNWTRDLVHPKDESYP